MITIKSFAKSKDKTTSNSNNNTGFANVTSIKKDLDTHLIFGQPFNGTQDVEGDLYNVNNINATGDLNCDSVNCNDVQTSGITTNDIQTRTLTSTQQIFTRHISNSGDITSDNVYCENLESTLMSVDDAIVGDLTVTGSAHFWELIIDKMKSTAGAVILSPANTTIEKIYQHPENGTYLCWRTEDDNKARSNDIEIDDQVLCLTFNQVTTGTTHQTSNKYYWGLVEDTGVITLYDEERYENCEWYYIKLDVNDYDGTYDFEVGDELAVLGNRTKPNRQNAIIMSCVDYPLDSGVTAPSIVQYKGINRFTLSGKRFNTIAANENVFYGNFKVVAGNTQTDVTDLINDSRSNVFSIEPDSTNTLIMTDEFSHISSVNDCVGLVNTLTLYQGSTPITTNGLNLSQSYVEFRGARHYLNGTISGVSVTDGVYISGVTVNQNDISITYTYSDESGHNYATMADSEFKAYIKITPSTTTYEKVLTIPAKVVKTQAGQNAQMYKMAVDEAYAMVSIEDKLAIRVNVHVQHINGNQIEDVQNISDFSVRMTSNASGTINVPANNSHFIYNNPQYRVAYSEQDTPQIYFTIILTYNGDDIDTYTIPVVFDSASIFTVQDDAITSSVQQAEIYTDGEITTVNNSISQIQQTANQISTRVLNIENDYITQSQLTQTANNIEAKVNNTGVNITDGTITLNSENTIINGNLNIKNPDEGLVIYDEYGNPKISIQNKELGNLEDFDFGEQKYIQQKQTITKSNASTQYQVTFAEQELGTYNAGQDLSITNIILKAYERDNVFNTRFTLSYDYIIKCNNTVVHNGTGTTTSDMVYNYYINDLLFNNLSTTGTYTIQFIFNGTTDNITTGTFINQLYFYASTTVTNINKVATDGALFASSQDNYNWLGNDQTLLKNGKSSIRIKDGKIERNTYNVGDNVHSNSYSDLSSTYPYIILNELTYNAGSDDGLICFSTVIGHNNNELRTLYLPQPSTMKGKIYKIKNLVGSSTRIRVYNSNTQYIMPPNSNSLVSYYNIGNASTTIISCNNFWLIF